MGKIVRENKIIQIHNKTKKKRQNFLPAEETET
jgi:hypothetical protein